MSERKRQRQRRILHEDFPLALCRGCQHLEGPACKNPSYRIIDLVHGGYIYPLASAARGDLHRCGEEANGYEPWKWRWKWTS